MDVNKTPIPRENSELELSMVPELWLEISHLSLLFSYSVLSDSLQDPMDCSTPGFPVHLLSLLKLMSIDLMMPSNHLILCHPLLLPSVFHSITIFSNESHLLPTPNIFMVQEKHEGPHTIFLSINFKSNTVKCKSHTNRMLSSIL